MRSKLPMPVDELSTLNMAFGLVSQPVFVLDPANHQIVDANPAACQVLNVARIDLVGQAWCALAPRLGAYQSHEIEVGGRRYLIAIHQIAAEESRGDAASCDVLTGLPNRRALFARFAADVHDSAQGKLSLMFIDLDHFKQINDTWGHVFGDRVLQIVAQRLLHGLRKSDLVVRYGGDEFIVVVEGVRRDDLERRADEIALAVQTPMLIDGRELLLSASIGIARHKDRAQKLEDLIAEADRAMYRAKSLSRSTAAASAAGWALPPPRAADDVRDERPPG